jgi:hypothetical protein
VKRLLLITFIIWNTSINAQVSENFSDGNFSDSPTWVGNTADFIVNSSKQLQSTASVAGTSYLSTNHQLTSIDSKEWRFWLKMAFSPSTNNYSKIYLSATNSDLSINPDGFYLQFGESGSADAIHLCKQQNGVSTVICSGLSGQIASSFAISVRVIRDISGNWKLYVDPSGNENYSSYSIGNDPASIVGTSVGILCKYTISNANKFYLDNFYVGNEILDLTPPKIVSAEAIFSNQIDVLFDQAIETVSAQNILNYSISPFIGIALAVVDNQNPELVHLSLSSPLKNGQSYVLTSMNSTDYSGNIAGNQTVTVSFMTAEIPILGDVIITEFMADPSPSIGLPEVEFIEIYNRSSKYFNLQGWKIGDNSSDGTLNKKWLSPGEYAILCSTASSTECPNSIGVTNFPSLNNAGDDIVLKFNNGVIIDKITYSDSWYKDDLKKEGGYSIERINLVLPCSNASNWMASNAISGGTPTLINSTNNNVQDTVKPIITNLLTSKSNRLDLYFNEGMDSSSLANSTISFSPPISFQKVLISSFFPSQISFDFSENLIGSKEYSILLNSVSDCSMNTTSLIGKFALAELPKKGDIVVNEILFDPLSGGSDFIELFNNSSKFIDLKDCILANYEKGVPANYKSITTHFNLKSGEYVVITADSSSQKQNYSFATSGRFIQQELPNYNIDSSSVVLMCNQEIIDKVSYSKEWQFTLIDDVKGKSLERIDSKGVSSISSNWHTAAESVNFATPGRINSQDYKADSKGDFDYTNKTISPNNDGFEDILQVNYAFLLSGMVGTFSIYDAEGRLVKLVLNNELLATSGSFYWDGITNTQTKANIGTYIGVFEAFDSNGGNVFTKTKAFVVAGNL